MKDINKLIDQNCIEIKRKEKKTFFATVVGFNLKNAREKKSLSQQQVAELLSLDSTQISHFEAGRRIPSLLVFQELCDLYNVAPQDILATDIDQIGGKLASDFNLADPSKKRIICRNLKPSNQWSQQPAIPC